MKAFIKRDVEEAIRTLDVEAVELAGPEARSVREGAARAFGDGASPFVHWNHLREYSAVQHPDSWEWIGEFVQGPAYLFFDERDEPGVFRFNEAQRIRDVLEECSGFEFYICDLKYAYLLCNNDHDYLIGSGKAQEWVKSLQPRHDAWARSLPHGKA
jgi:hypothetical protein